MFLRQFIDPKTNSYSYLIADECNQQAAIIDPVSTQLPLYFKLLDYYQWQLRWILDSHTHADHVTGSGQLKRKTSAKSLIGNKNITCVDMHLTDDQYLPLGQYNLKAIATPGHTDDSFCFYIKDDGAGLLFTGDTLLINGTGRTDFQNGCPEQLFNSIHNKLFALPDTTRIFPGHDYNGLTASTIGEEKRFNPRLQIRQPDAFMAHMNQLNLAPPKYLNEALPKNLHCGL